MKKSSPNQLESNQKTSEQNCSQHSSKASKSCSLILDEEKIEDLHENE